MKRLLFLLPILSGSLWGAYIPGPSVDSTTFTLGTTPEMPIGGVYMINPQPVGISSPTAAVRITPYRSLYVTPTDAAGVVLGTSTANPIFHYTTNLTTVTFNGTGQPVTQSGTWTVQPGNTPNTAPWLVQVSTLMIHNGNDGVQTVGYQTGGSSVPVNVLNNVTVTQATASNLKVDLSGTAANATAIKVDGSAVTQPVYVNNVTTSPVAILNGNSGITSVGYQAGGGSVPVHEIGTANSYITNVTTSPIQISNGAGSMINVGYGVTAGSVPVSIQQVGPYVAGTIKTATDIVASTFTGANMSLVEFSVFPGTTTGLTLNFEASFDSGTVWFPLYCVQASTEIMATSFAVGTSTTVWIGEVYGMTNFRARASALTNGISSVTILTTMLPVVIRNAASLVTQTGNGVPAFVGYQTGGSSVPVNVINTANVSSVYGAPTATALSSTTLNYAVTGDSIVVAGVASQTVRVWRMILNVDAATSITFKDGSLSLTGPMKMTAGGSMILDFEGDPWFVSTASNGFTINQTGTAQISGRIYWTRS